MKGNRSKIRWLLFYQHDPPAPVRASSIEALNFSRKKPACEISCLLLVVLMSLIVGIGATRQCGRATLLRTGYITEEKQQTLRSQGAVGI